MSLKHSRILNLSFALQTGSRYSTKQKKNDVLSPQTGCSKPRNKSWMNILNTFNYMQKNINFVLTVVNAFISLSKWVLVWILFNKQVKKTMRTWGIPWLLPVQPDWKPKMLPCLYFTHRHTHKRENVSIPLKIKIIFYFLFLSNYAKFALNFL